jgi:DNA polymerase (family 10)
MPIHNVEIAEAFNRLADLLEIEGANPFRVRAYRNAARTVQDLPRSAAAMLAAGEDFSELPGIGRDLAGKIAELIGTGHLTLLDEVAKRTPKTLADLATIPGLGPKRVKALYQDLKIETPADLVAAVESGRVRALPGFGAKTEQKILSELRRTGAPEQRMRLFDAEQFAGPLLAYLKGQKGAMEATIAGSYRRRKETVGDLDILVTAKRGAKIADRFMAYDEVDRVVSKGPTRSAVILRCGLQVDLRVVPEASYGAALLYFTGSKAHNIALRKRAVKRAWKLNEYGLFDGDQRIAGRTEKEVYDRFSLAFIPPELREDTGEIEAAAKGRLPELVTLSQIRGDLHVHTTASDGKFSITEMAEAAKARGYDYLAVTDHSKHATVARGLDANRLAEQVDEIERVNEALEGIRILKSSEVDILEDGKLDYPDSILKRLDFTVCAIHYRFDLPADKQTARVIRAMDNPYFNILAHPTGRLINERRAYDIDLQRVMQVALERGCFLEINAHPSRLDLDDPHCRMAKEMGLKIAISTDAHTANGLDMMRFGVDQARRGWLEAGDVLNTRSWAELAELLRRR